MCAAACFCAPFCQLCGSVLIHDPGQKKKCMSSAPLFEDKRLHVCASSHMGAFMLRLPRTLLDLTCVSVRSR